MTRLLLCFVLLRAQAASPKTNLGRLNNVVKSISRYVKQGTAVALESTS